MQLSDEEKKLYAQQVCLPEIGITGQEKLKSTRILVVGTGGLGSPALLYLAASGFGTIGICEFDQLELSNLHRQILFSHCDIGGKKAELAAQRIKDTNPFIKVRLYNERVNPENVERIAKEYDIILDCTDNFSAKFLLNDCAVLYKIPLIQASVYQWEGQIKSYIPKESSCLRCLWPMIPEECDGGVCATVGVFGVVPGALGVMQVAEAVKCVLNLPGRLRDDMLIIDFLTLRIHRITVGKDPSCPVCGVHPTITKIIPENYLPQVDIDISRLPQEEFTQYQCVDVREPHERVKNPSLLKDCLEFPFSKFKEINYAFDGNKKYLIFCEKGVRSERFARYLREQGLRNVFSVRDGVFAVREYLKTHFPS